MRFTDIPLWLITQAQTAADAAGVTPVATPSSVPVATPAAIPTPALTPDVAAQGAFGSGIEQALLSIAKESHTAILYLLIGLSILSLGVAIEKLIQYKRDNPLGEEFKGDFIKLMDKGDLAAALALMDGARGIKAAVLREGLKNFNEGSFVMTELMDSRSVLERNRLDKRLIILGTIGSNAPYIGLLGTVMGIIKAFADLAQATTQGPAAVMQGISEALVATAVGLFVAIPAVIFFNYFKAQQKNLVDDAQSASNVLMAFSKRRDRVAERA